MKSSLPSIRRSTVERQLWALSIALALAASVPRLEAQNENAEVISNAVVEAAALMVSNAVSQFTELGATNEPSSNAVAQADETAFTNAPADTNLPPGNAGPPGPPESRRQWLLRQRAGAPVTNEPGAGRPGDGTNAAPASDFRPRKPEFSVFKLITERNIFDPNRVPHRPGGSPPKPKITESFALVGVMSYDKGTFAFFDGSSSEYRKAVKLNDSIGGYKLTNINPTSITLAAGTNQVELRVGMQLRREEGGSWTPSSQAEIYTADSKPASSVRSESAASGADSDVLERLRKRREQE